MPFTDAQLKDRVAGNQGVAAASLPAFWDLIVPPANAAAYGYVRRVLLDRGYSPAQVDAWDDLAEFQGAIGLFLALVDQKAGQAYDPLAKPVLDKLDRRAELLTVPVTIGGVLAGPANALTQSAVGHGPMATAKVRQPWEDRRGRCGTWRD